MSKKNDSRFDDLFSVVRSKPLSEDKPELAQETTRRSKSTDPNYVRTTVYLPKSLHKKLKSASAEQEREMSDIVEESLKQYLESQSHT